MSGDINGLPSDNMRTREATKIGSEADGPGHMKQPKQPARLLGRMGVVVEDRGDRKGRALRESRCRERWGSEIWL